MFIIKRMLAVHLEDGVVTVRHTARPERPAGYALLRLLVAGICNTDLELQRGYYGFRGTPGHEFVAEVVESDNPDLVDKWVVGDINLSCTTCDWCQGGLGRHCPNRTVLGIVNQPGAFQEYFILPDRNLHVVPETLPVESAVFAEPLAAACEILDQVPIPAGDTVAILGDGKLGLLIACVLRNHGCIVHQFGRYPEKLRIAASAGVITSTGLPTSTYAWTVEATGSPEGLLAAVAMTRPRGTLIMKSTVHGSVAVDTAPIIVNELTLIGSRCGRMEAALPLLERGVVPVQSMIADLYSLSDAPRAFARAAQPGTLKVLLTP